MSYLPNFSHIYIESQVKGNDLASQCINRFPRAKIIEIIDYKSIFNRPNQDFQTQKKSTKLILAKKNPPFIYPATDILQDGGFRNFYYTTPVINCIYNCDYCFLQGMYSSSNIVIFTNIEDMQNAVHEEMKSRPFPTEPMMLSISYNTDILAFENILPLTHEWINFANKLDDLHLEIRTKSAQIDAIKDIKPSNKILLAWTLSPDSVIKDHEHKTPLFQRRLSVIQDMLEKGWAVRLCFDPILLYPDWEKDYQHMFQKIKDNINGDQLFDITVGVFRMGEDHFHRIKRKKPDSNIYYNKYVNKDGILSLPENEKDKINNFVLENLSEFCSKDKIHFWM